VTLAEDGEAWKELVGEKEEVTNVTWPRPARDQREGEEERNMKPRNIGIDRKNCKQ